MNISALLERCREAIQEAREEAEAVYDNFDNSLAALEKMRVLQQLLNDIDKEVG